MTAALPSCSALLLAAATPDPSDDVLNTLLVLALTPLLLLGISWLGASPRVQTSVRNQPPNKPGSRPQPSPTHAEPVARKPVPRSKPSPTRAEPAAREKPVPRCKPEPEKAPPTRGTEVAPSVPGQRRRVIRLHSTTPGQAPHEYNIGDEQGTRGSALVRAA